MSRLFILLVAASLIGGCGRSAPPGPGSGTSGSGASGSGTSGSGTSGTTAAGPTTRSLDELVVAARRFVRNGQWDEAADATQKVLVEDPDHEEATFLASQAEAARGNHQISANLAGSIDVGSRFGSRAVEIHWQQLAKLKQPSAAADVLLLGLEEMPGEIAWRHRAWSLLNQAGRRQHASLQADILSRAGQAGYDELVSLLRRGDAFPLRISDEGNPQAYFQPGLGTATWYFTKRDYRRALDELAGEREGGFPTPAARALYGRLLAETQSLEFPSWHAGCRDDEEAFSDYWGALGAYFFDQHQFEASTRALMEALFRDPSDDLSAHRLARALDALGRSEDAAQIRDRAVQIVQVEQDAQRLADPAAADLGTRKELPQKLLKLGRPFEALGWTLMNLPPSAVAARTEVLRKLSTLSRDSKAIAMAGEMSWMGIDPKQFRMNSAMEELRKVTPQSVASRATDVELPATPRLVNVADKVGLSFQWYQDQAINLASIPIHEMMGGGLAVIDYDLDGWPDVYAAQGSGDPPTDACTRSSMLFRNVGGQYETMTTPAGADDFNYSTGIAAGDVNQDGFTDLLLGSLGHNRLLINNGDGTFQDATDQLGDVADRFTSSLAIADINGDALPDLFEAIYLEMKGGFKLPEVGSDGRELQPTPQSFYAQSDRWFENLGDGSFRSRQVSTETAEPGTSLGVVVTDFDSNGSNEIFIGNDGRPNHFLVQAGDNKFRNRAGVMGLASGFGGEPNACMGIATADFNRDGTMDLHITNFLKESANHYLQIGSGFSDFASRFGLDTLSVPYVGFGTKAGDIDRNGWPDLIVSNGHVFDRRHLGEPFQMPPQCLLNLGDRFEQVTVDDDSGYWNNDYLGRTVALTDFDRDGAIDFLVGHFDQPLALLRNETNSPAHWIQLELVGTKSERDAIGAKVLLTGGGQQWVAWVTAGDGYLCSDEAVLDFGLGKNQKIDQLQIVWPSGEVQAFPQPAVDRRYLIIEGQPEIHPRRLVVSSDLSELSLEHP